MRILISSKKLQTALNNSFSKENCQVSAAVLFGNILTLYSKDKASVVSISVMNIDGNGTENQENVNWHAIKTLMNNVEEQPVTLDITEKCTRIIFEY